MAEADAAGNVVKSYGYRPGSTWTTDPLFMKVGGQYYFYQNDHLGTPQKLTAVNGAVVWSAKYSSFGKSTVEVNVVENNLRFPGQYFDQETNLHYNYFRYYNSKIGRYLRVDPLGFEGGFSFYVYGHNNPSKYIDPFGLIDWDAFFADPDVPSNFIDYDLDTQKAIIEAWKRKQESKEGPQITMIFKPYVHSGKPSCLADWEKCMFSCLKDNPALLEFVEEHPICTEIYVNLVGASGGHPVGIEIATGINYGCKAATGVTAAIRKGAEGYEHAKGCFDKCAPKAAKCSGCEN